MRRYDALSDNSYLHAIGPLTHAQNGASNATGTMTGQNGMIWQAE